jgi:hypothetical protein
VLLGKQNKNKTKNSKQSKQTQKQNIDSKQEQQLLYN